MGGQKAQKRNGARINGDSTPDFEHLVKERLIQGCAGILTGDLGSIS